MSELQETLKENPIFMLSGHKNAKLLSHVTQTQWDHSTYIFKMYWSAEKQKHSCVIIATDISPLPLKNKVLRNERSEFLSLTFIYLTFTFTKSKQKAGVNNLQIAESLLLCCLFLQLFHSTVCCIRHHRLVSPHKQQPRATASVSKISVSDHCLW